MRDTDDVDGTDAAVVLNYRFHLAPKRESVLVGSYAR